MAINNNIDVKIQGSYGFDQSSAGGANGVSSNPEPKLHQTLKLIQEDLYSKGVDTKIILTSRHNTPSLYNVTANNSPKTSIGQKIKNFFSRNDASAKAAMAFSKAAQAMANSDIETAGILNDAAKNLLSQSKKHTGKTEQFVNNQKSKAISELKESKDLENLYRHKEDYLAKQAASQGASSTASKPPVETPSQPASPASVETKQATTVETPKETPLPSVLKASGEKPQNIKHAMFPAEVTSTSSNPAAPKNVKINADFVKNNNYNTLSRDLATKTFQATNKANWNDQYLGSLTNSINNLNRFINIFSDANAKGSPGEQGASIDNYRPSKAECESLKKQLTQLKDNIKEFGFQRINIPQSLRDIEQRKKIAQEGNTRNEGFKNISNQIDTLLNKLNSITEFSEKDTPSVGRNFLNQMEKNDGVRPADQDVKDAQYMAKMWGYNI